MSDNWPEDLKRPTRPPDGQRTLFEVEPDWRDAWWGMPEFEMQDASPQYSVTINFLTREHLREFSERFGLRLNPRSDSAWCPDQRPLSGDFEYDGPPTPSKYPICIPSKGRAHNQKTARNLDRMGVEYRVFVEEPEASLYRSVIDSSRVVEMPFSDLGQGSIPARNYIWDWAAERGFARHWVVDDNIVSFARCHNNRRLNVRGGGFFRAMEEFIDRYENIVLAGPHDKAFVPDRSPTLSPFILNRRIYSCILIDTNADYRWRGRYNEDTDLSLRVLKDGRCTCLFRALLIDKTATYYGNGKLTPTQKGGNTDSVYATDDYRRQFAESIVAQHPDVAKVVWKFNRWHHEIDYSPFAGNKPILSGDVTPTRDSNNFGMELVRVSK